MVGKDEVGQAVLEWKVDYRATKRQESDPCARTYDFLKRLDVPDLEVVEDNRSRASSKATTKGRNPYDSGVYAAPKIGRR